MLNHDFCILLPCRVLHDKKEGPEVDCAYGAVFSIVAPVFARHLIHHHHQVVFGQEYLQINQLIIQSNTMLTLCCYGVGFVQIQMEILCMNLKAD